MPTGPELKKSCEQKLWAQIRNGEPVLATGTADEFRDTDRDVGTQGAWRFLLVTDRRLLLSDWSDPRGEIREIDFADVVAWSDGTQYHRYVLTLDQRARGDPLPRRQLFGLMWRKERKQRSRTRIVLRFSRRDTAAAVALRQALEQLQLPHGRLQLPEQPRGERIKGSHVILTQPRRNGTSSS